jgi:hypothetical protein
LALKIPLSKIALRKCPFEDFPLGSFALKSVLSRIPLLKFPAEDSSLENLALKIPSIDSLLKVPLLRKLV